MRGDDRQRRFSEIYDAYSGLILAYALRRTTDPMDAADIVAETFTVAWRRMDDVPAGEEARAWLYGVGRKVLSNHHRDNRRRRRLNERMGAQMAYVAAPAVSVEDGPEREMIAAAFAQLSDADRELLTLVGWEQLNRDEIAKVIGASRAVVRVRLHRARKRFEKALAAAGLKRLASPGHGTGRWVSALPDPEEAR